MENSKADKRLICFIMRVIKFSSINLEHKVFIVLPNKLITQTNNRDKKLVSLSISCFLLIK